MDSSSPSLSTLLNPSCVAKFLAASCTIQAVVVDLPALHEQKGGQAGKVHQSRMRMWVHAADMTQFPQVRPPKRVHFTRYQMYACIQCANCK